MQQLSADKQNNIPRFLIVVTAVIFVVAIVLSIWILRPADVQLVEVVSDGEVLYTIDLAQAEDREFTIEYNGSSNTIQVKDGEIWVREALCPDQTCVNMGKLHSESMPIICLPNRLIIRFAE